MDTANLVEFFCIFDEFCKYFNIELKKHVIEDSNKRHRNRKGRMSDSEIMTILVLFHTSHFRDLKTFYLGYMQSYEERISQRHLLQPFRRASDKCGHEPSVVLPDLRFGKVFRHIHHRLYSTQVMPYQA